ncbi:hypothetical protein DYB37_013338, partial [Aphanomyces astaci]
MSCADFVKNNLNYGLSNQGTPLPEPFLISIYHNIATNQFRTSDTDPFGPDRYCSVIHSSNRRVGDLAMQLVVLTGLVSASLRCAALVDRVVQVLATASTLLDTIDTQETLQGATADETKAFVLTVRSLARAKRRSSKKSGGGGYLDSFMSRLFFFSDEPLDQHAASVADNFELRVDDLLLDEDDDVASAQVNNTTTTSL